MTERQELHCHNCNNYVQFDIDLELNGNHVLTCPVCGHEHCRVVDNGRITEERWDQRNPSYMVSSTSVTWSSSSITSSSSTTGTSIFLTGAWMDTTSYSGYAVTYAPVS